MEFGEIRLENVGPIRRAAIGRHRVSVFVGPNNSGKSVAARIVHGACLLDMPAAAEIRILADGRPCREEGDGGEAAADAARTEALLRCAGIGRGGAASHSAGSARITLGCGIATGGRAGTEADAGRGGGGGGGNEHGPDSHPASSARADGEAMCSVYIPAGRAGAVWSVLAAAQLEGGRPGAARPLAGEGSARTLGGPPREDVPGEPGPRVPEHLGPFCKVVFEAFSGGLGADAGGMFSRLFGGSIEPCAAGALPAVRYRDPSGEAVDIGSAGSGVVSALPVVAAVHRVDPGGTLVVEEPEADAEAMGQLRLAGELVRAALRRGVRLVLTTHSDFVVHALLGMVHNGDIDPGDLGLYYFRRERGSRTDVERVDVNRAGEAETDMFDEALDALAKGSVV